MPIESNPCCSAFAEVVSTVNRHWAALSLASPKHRVTSNYQSGKGGFEALLCAQGPSWQGWQATFSSCSKGQGVGCNRVGKDSVPDTSYHMLQLNCPITALACQTCPWGQCTSGQKGGAQEIRPCAQLPPLHPHPPNSRPPSAHPLKPQAYHIPSQTQCSLRGSDCS